MKQLIAKRVRTKMDLKSENAYSDRLPWQEHYPAFFVDLQCALRSIDIFDTVYFNLYHWY